MQMLSMHPAYAQCASSTLYICCELTIVFTKYGQKLGAQRRITNCIVHLTRSACVHLVWLGLYVKQWFSTGVPRNPRVLQASAKGSAASQ